MICCNRARFVSTQEPFGAVFSTLSLTNHLNRQTFALMHDSSAPGYTLDRYYNLWRRMRATDRGASCLIPRARCSSFLIKHCLRIVFSHCVHLRVQRCSDSRRADAAVLPVSPYMMDASPTSHRGFEIRRYLAVFLRHYSSRQNSGVHISPGLM